MRPLRYDGEGMTIVNEKNKITEEMTIINVLPEKLKQILSRMKINSLRPKGVVTVEGFVDDGKNS